MINVRKEVDPENTVRCDCCGKSRTTTYTLTGEFGNQYEGLLLCRMGLYELKRTIHHLTKRAK